MRAPGEPQRSLAAVAGPLAGHAAGPAALSWTPWWRACAATCQDDGASYSVHGDPGSSRSPVAAGAAAHAHQQPGLGGHPASANARMLNATLAMYDARAMACADRPVLARPATCAHARLPPPTSSRTCWPWTWRAARLACLPVGWERARRVLEPDYMFWKNHLVVAQQFLKRFRKIGITRL